MSEDNMQITSSTIPSYFSAAWYTALACMPSVFFRDA